MRKFWSFGLCLLAATLTLAPSERATAQSSGTSIERVANQQLTGKAYARYTGGTFEQCQSRCLADKRCMALEHNRGGGRVTNRYVYCRLYSARSETRTSQFADVGFKTEAAPPASPSVAGGGAGGSDQKKAAQASEAQQAPARKADDDRRGAEARRAQEQLQAQQRETAAVQQEAARKSQAETRQQADRSVQAPRPSPPPAPPVVAFPAPSAPAPSASGPSAGGAPPVTTPPAASPAPTAAPPAAASKEPARPSTRSMSPSARAVPPEPTPDWDVVPVYYGTDRSRRTLAKRITYGSDRARRLELGQALITVPKLHQVPNVERPWAIKIPYLDITLYQESEDPKKHFTIKELTALSRDEMLALVRARLASSKNFKDQALVMIHGYNNGFDDALFRTAQISYDLKFDGAPFLYSWPSGSGIISYPYDRESAIQAEQYLSQFLLLVLNETGAKAVNIIAHSMGNQPLLNVLRELKRSNPADVARINQIILAAPDVDRDAFEYIAGQLQGVSRGITMYVSSNDAALGISRRFAGGVPRAGDVPADIGPSVVAGIDTIDVSALSTDYLAINHSNYAEKSALIQDIELVFRTGERPPENRLPILKRMPSPKGDFWRYPN